MNDKITKKKRFEDLLDKIIDNEPLSKRYCCIRKGPYPITKLKDFNCFDCKMFVLNEGPETICDPL